MEFVRTEAISPCDGCLSVEPTRFAGRLEKAWGATHYCITQEYLSQGLRVWVPRVRLQGPKAKGSTGKRPCVAAYP